MTESKGSKASQSTSKPAATGDSRNSDARSKSSFSDTDDDDDDVDFHSSVQSRSQGKEQAWSTKSKDKVPRSTLLSLR